MSTPREMYPMIQRLLDNAGDRAMLAALRRGLGQPPGAAPDMFPFVAPFAQRNESAAYLIAALFGLHPANTNQGNLGTHFRRLVLEGSGEDAVERRFTHLLRSRREDLDDPLRQAVSLLKSKDVPVNWQQLMDDVLHWSDPNHRVQRRWASQFWADDERTSSTETDNA